MSNPTANFGWVMPTATDLVTDLPADFAVFGQAVDTSMAGLLGGTTGQVLSKTSGTNMAFTWVTPELGDITAVTAGTGISGGGTTGAVTITNSMATAITTSGDLVQGTGSGTFARLGTGTNGQFLTTNGTTNSWTAAPSGALTLSTIASGTLSGTALNLTGLTQDFLQLRLAAPTWATSASYIRVRINNSSAATYDQLAVQQIGTTTYGRDYNNSTAYDSCLPTGNQSQLNTNANGFYVMNFWQCQKSGFTTYQIISYCEQTGSVAMISNNWGVYKTAAAVSSLYVFLNGGQSFNGGTYSLIGG
jgi:hypothetical protein